ncbi:methyltransferase [Candidatus Nardonella dryophthoridicola]|uniref:methyltransferase n=1 Tax=Candidatus Nardonella dryophthoridicola TaxID=1971485 RepID=UPI003B96EE25
MNIYFFKNNSINNKITINKIFILNKYIIKLINDYPIEYIFKKVNFFSINIKINNNIFIPRIETELLINFINNYIIKNNIYKILDIGTGSGIIPIILLKNNKNLYINAIDINLYSIIISRINAKKILTIKNNKKIKFILYDILKYHIINNIKYDIIISNPPYISYKNLNICSNNIFYEP